MENFDINNLANEGRENVGLNPDPGKLISHGHEYEDTPRMRSLIEKANEIRGSVSAIPEGYSRLWRANRPGEVGKNPSYTNSLEGIALPFLEGYGGKISYVDIPEEDLVKYVRDGVVAPGAEFVLPLEVLKQVEVVESIGSEKETSDTSFDQQKKYSFSDSV